jgi:hypothetical protein
VLHAGQSAAVSVAASVAESAAAGGAKLPTPGTNGGANGIAKGGANGGVRPPAQCDGLRSPSSQIPSPPTSPINSPSGSSAGQRSSVEGLSGGDAAAQRRSAQTSVARKRGFVVRGQDSTRVAGARLQSLQHSVLGLLRHVEAHGPVWGCDGGAGQEAADAGGWLDPSTNVLAVLPRAVEALAQQNEQLREHNRLLREMKGMLGWAPPPPRATPSLASSLRGSRAASGIDLTERSYDDGGLSGTTLSSTPTSSLAEHSAEVGRSCLTSSSVPSRPVSRPVSPRATMQAPPSACGRPHEGPQLQ